MTFDEWWGGDRDRTTAYDLMKVLSEAAAQAWRAAEAATREEMLTQWNHTGVDIDAALHGRVNEQSPIANRLRMIANAVPQWRPMATYEEDTCVLFYVTKSGRSMPWQAGSGKNNEFGEWAVFDAFGDDTGLGFDDLVGWMPLPPPPEKTE